MSYIVFALKWRPKKFEEIVGQDTIVATLKNAIQKQRLAHAYLFSGPRGVGKTSAARILAKALNCKDGPTVSPCGACPACLDIANGRSLDVIEIDGASNRGIDEIRALRENVKFAPTQGKFKIYIIDEVHQITPEGFNALLKTLEEPPPFVKFIFATTHPHKVIPTILSRCQRLDFRRISVIEIIAQLEKIALDEHINIDKKVLFAIAKSSDGSLRDAESILDQLMAFTKSSASLEDVNSMLGLVEQDTLFDIASTIINKDPKRALELLNRVVDSGKDIANFLVNLIEHFRNLMIAKVTQADPKLIDLPQDICDNLLKQAQAFSMEEIFGAFNIMVNTQEMAKRLDSLRIPLEISLVKLAHDKKAVKPVPAARPKEEDPPVRLKDEEPPAPEEDKNEKKPGIEEGAPVSHSGGSLEAVKAVWRSAIDNLSKIKISAATYLDEGTPTKFANGALTISFPINHSLHKESLERKENKGVIEKVLSELLGFSVRANFILSKEVQPKTNNETSPFVKSALHMFNGRVIKEE